MISILPRSSGRERLPKEFIRIFTHHVWAWVFYLGIFFYPEGLKLQAREESVAVTKCKVVFSQWKPIKCPTENINTVHANVVWGVNSWRGEE